MHIDVKGYANLIREGKFDDALRLIREYVPFPEVLERICPHPCESECLRGEIDEPIAINALKRSAGDYGKAPIQNPANVQKRKEKVAIVGSGPAGLTAAYYLVQEGYPVTVFEKLDVAGGMMAVGIPEFRLPREALRSEIQVIQDMGVEVKTGVTFGEDITLEGLKKQGYVALFMAMGLHRSISLKVEGEDLPNVLKGIEFLREVISGKKVSVGKNVVVIGGGNVAIDVALTAKRLGAQRISIVCLEKREEMPAWDYEIKEALEEGVTILNSLGPKRFLEKDGKLSGIEFKCCAAVYDERGAFNPCYNEADVTMVDADTAIIAIGQTGDFSFAKKEGIPVAAGKLKVDPFTLQTQIEWVFAGGDAIYGPKTVVEALASGKKAAESIKRYIQGEYLTADRAWDGPFECRLDLEPKDTLLKKRCHCHTLDIDQRQGNFREINLSLEKQEAVEEAERCLSCECNYCEMICPSGAIKVVSQRTQVDEAKCIACFRCVDACPQSAIEIVSRHEPVVLRVDPSEVDQASLKELCIKAHLHPRQILCLCSGTRVDEAAAAVLKGAKSPEDIAVMTGAFSGCGIYCMQPTLRLLKAHGVDLDEPHNHRWYNITPSLWEMPAALAEKYPGYYLEEDKKVYKKVR
jgi:NADPH-dependent glutamate synthase beta subunit-like oxidoreductase/ferredoxin